MKAVKERTRLGREIVQIIKSLETHLQRPPSRWRQEDLHQIRIDARIILAFHQIIKKPKRDNESLKAFKMILRQLLKDTGQVRDLDVAIKLSTQFLVPRQARLSQKNKRSRMFEVMKKNWARERRHDLLQHLAPYTETPVRVSRRKYQKRLQFFRKNLKTQSHLQTGKKQQLHQARKFFRKLRYLLMIQDIQLPGLVFIQNKLGTIHDLENLQSFIGNNGLIQKEIRTQIDSFREKGSNKVRKIREQLRTCF
jgi:CHAD domain-containing protein